MYACMYVCMYVCRKMGLMCVCMHERVYVFIISMRKMGCMHACMHVCMHVCMYVFMLGMRRMRRMYVCMYVCMYGRMLGHNATCKILGTSQRFSTAFGTNLLLNSVGACFTYLHLNGFQRLLVPVYY